MEIPAQYNPLSVENKWYEYWLKNQYFNSQPNEKEAYTIVMPPPNVTGVLHMGHMLNNTLQDVLIRRARMTGYNPCWVPGTDHASIATEAKVVDKLKKQGIDKKNLSREEFLTHAWDWTNEHGGIILEQVKKIGASCDWNRTKFTLDDDLSESVTEVFINLYQKGLIYRGYRMVNWDPEAKTTLSDEEVVYEERQGKLYYIKYKIEGTEEFLHVATTRPETILGDTAICVHPDDERYQQFIGKKVLVPIANRWIPIIADEYVDKEFGTGCLKITPAHDVNDQQIGVKHQLEIIDILNEDGTLNEKGLHYVGRDRFDVRTAIIQEMKSSDLVQKIEDYTNKVGLSERTKAVIEPRLSYQWFLKMETIAKKALDVVLDGEIKFHPERYVNTYKHWLENIRDWNISRQLWWGHRIPAYFYGKGPEDFVVAETIEKALFIAKKKLNDTTLTIEDLRQEEDALDTWFSSWLWPLSVFDGIRNPENEEFNYYYPTADLVTGPDIIFFWVARMIMAGNEFKQKIPFKNVYFTGIVRDKQRRKMSKSLGNSPDPIELINQFGADGVRVGLMLSASAGSDLLFDEELCAQGRNFSNKIWNAFRLIKSWTIDSNEQQPIHSAQANEWLEHKITQVQNEVANDFKQYKLSDAMMRLYKLIWDDFCSVYLEIIKPAFGKGIDQKTYDNCIVYLEKVLQLLHPFMPFITEEIWQHITERTPEQALVITQLPTVSTNYNETLLEDFIVAQEIISAIRTIRKDKNISFKESLDWVVLSDAPKQFHAVIEKLTNTKTSIQSEKPASAFAFRVNGFEYFIPMGDAIDVEAERTKLQEELTYLEGFIQSVLKKLQNERFVQGAPEAVVAAEKKKQADAQAKIDLIKQSLDNL